ncbi:MAG: hypothetical protein DDT18_01337 [Actinobacteria bacterium]|nr:hypothetical protein [Actinomycetota bacterium]
MAASTLARASSTLSPSSTRSITAAVIVVSSSRPGSATRAALRAVSASASGIPASSRSIFAATMVLTSSRSSARDTPAPTLASTRAKTARMLSGDAPASCRSIIAAVIVVSSSRPGSATRALSSMDKASSSVIPASIMSTSAAAMVPNSSLNRAGSMPSFSCRSSTAVVAWGPTAATRSA